MSEGSITFSTALDNAQLEKDLASLNKKIEKTEQKIADLTTKRNEAREKGIFDGAVLDGEKAALQEIKDRLADIRAMSGDKSLAPETREEAKALLPSVQEEWSGQRTRVRMLQAEWDKTENAVDRYTAQLSDADAALSRYKEEAGYLHQQILEAGQARAELEKNAEVSEQRIVDRNRELLKLKERQKELERGGMGLGYREYDETTRRIAALNEELQAYQASLRGAKEAPQDMGKAARKAASHMDSFGKRLKGILASAFIFNVLSAGLRQLTGWMGKSIRANDQARQAIARLKGALLTLAQPLIEVVIPAFTLLINILARVVTAVAQLVSAIFGKTLKQSKDGAKALYEEANAIKGVGSAADEAAGSLAGFDEVNTISTENAGGAGGGISDSAIKPDFTGMIEGELSKIATLVGAALLAIGAILTFSGANIPLGIALMAAGAITLVSVIATDWNSIEKMLQGPIGTVTAIVSVALLALGAILAFSTVNIPLGIALMALGALGLAAVAAANWDALPALLQGPIGTVTTIVSVALLAVGAVLLFSSANIPLGLGLLSVGAVGLAASIAANWEAIQTAMQGPVGTITILISAALLAVGAALLFSGANIPLGLGLLSVGAVGLAVSIAANWDAITAAVGGTVQTLTIIVSAALLVLGIILLFSGGAAPLGLGLLAAGAVGLAATIVPNWNFILEAVQDAWSSLKNWWNTNAAKFFTLDYWLNLGKGMVDGLLKGLRNIWSGLTDWVGGVKNAIDDAFSSSSSRGSIRNTGYTKRTMPMAAALPEISTRSVPALAKGAVIPPNREFLAVLGDQRSGTNIEAPVSEIENAVARGMASAGMSGQAVALLEAILEAVRAGHIIMVDRIKLGQTVEAELNRRTRASGRSAILT